MYFFLLPYILVVSVYLKCYLLFLLPLPKREKLHFYTSVQTCTHPYFLVHGGPSSLPSSLSAGSTVCLSIMKLILCQTYFRGSSTCQIYFVITKFNHTQDLAFPLKCLRQMFGSSQQDDAVLSTASCIS